MKVYKNKIVFDLLDSCSICEKKKCPIMKKIKKLLLLEIIIKNCPWRIKEDGNQ